MNRHLQVWTVCAAIGLCSLSVGAAQPDNPAIDAIGYQFDVAAAMLQRQARRVDDDEFIRLARLPDAVILDARSPDAYALRHVAGAAHLNYTDFTAETLAGVIPSKRTRILIYCNNNFLDSPAAFAAKSARASLNPATFAALRSYGYENVYELGTLRSVSDSPLPFAGSEVDR